MTIKNYRSNFIEQLAPIYDVMEAESFFYLTLEHYTKMKRIDLALQPEAVFGTDDIGKWNSVLEQLKKEVPIQYILGSAHFYGLDFTVNSNVLIPRPETEELVERIINENEFRESLRILDIGTGSGCIAISLAKNLPGSKVSATDVSEGALALAKENAVNNEVSVEFIEMDILSASTLNSEWDIIVSNPPYVRNLEKEEIKRNVLEYEPHLALFVEDDDALLFYRKISDLALNHLSDNGKLYFEINQYLGEETVKMLEDKGFIDVKLIQDIYGNNRIVTANK